MKIIGFVAASILGVLFSCKPDKKTADVNSNDTTMSVTTRDLKKSNRIKGPSGLLYVEDGGEGGIPVLFAHSFGGNTTQWENQREHLEGERRVVTFDFREHGQSEAPADKNFSAQAMADDIAAVADSLKLGRFVLIGHSQGGSAAIAYASAHPDRVAGLVLAGTPGKSDPEQAKQVVSSLKTDAYQKVMDQYMARLLTDAKPEVNSAVSKDVKKISRETSIKIIESLFQYDPIPDLKAYKGPVLIISTSSEDSQPNTLASQLPDIDHKTIAGTSHWSQLDKPEEFNRILDEFLKTIK